MNKKELIEFIDRITQGRKLPIEMYNARRIKDTEICVDCINIECDVNGEEFEFHFKTDFLIDWAFNENMHLFEWFGNIKEMTREDWMNLTEDEDLINTCGMFLNELR